MVAIPSPRLTDRPAPEGRVSTSECPLGSRAIRIFQGLALGPAIQGGFISGMRGDEYYDCL